MALKKLLPLAVAAGALFASASASAVAVVTLNPQANNGGLGVVDATEAAFDATGFLGSLGSTLQISGNSGVQSFIETGRVAVSDFQLNDANLNSNVADTYRLFADFTLTGFGAWTGSTYNAAAAGATLSLTFGADTNLDNVVDIVLGTGSLNASQPALAFALLAGSTAVGSSGNAFTTFAATIDFTPAAGTEGAGGFFQAPSPFSIDIVTGNVGGNFNDTSYIVNADGSVSITTVGGSGNFDFVNNVPEPSALALVGLALAGAGLASRRRKVVA